MKGLEPSNFRDYADFLLGEHIYGLRAGVNGEVRPSWELLLKFEFECRKRMAELVSEGETMADALERVTKSSTLRDLHIVTPIATGKGVKRTAAAITDGSEQRDHPDRFYKE